MKLLYFIRSANAKKSGLCCRRFRAIWNVWWGLIESKKFFKKKSGECIITSRMFVVHSTIKQRTFQSN